MNTAEVATASRPRVEGEREVEIHNAVIQLLIEVGYDKLTLDAVATQAHASKATLYRRWSSKSALVIDAVVGQLCPNAAEVPDTGSLRGDLTAGACEEGGLTSELPGLIGAVIPALHRDADLYEAFRRRFIEPSLARALTIFRRAQQRGEVGSDADLTQLTTILPAMCIHETVIFGRKIDRSSVLKIIDQVVLPACAASLP